MKRGQILTPAFMLTLSIIIIIAIILVLLLLPVTKNQLTEPAETESNETRGSSSCVFTNAYWTKSGQQITQASEGDLLELAVESQNCNGQIIEFEVWTGTSIIGTSAKIIVTSRITAAGWRAPTTGSPYGIHFIAKIQGSAISIKGPNLIINPLIDTNETEINETEVNTTEPLTYDCPYGNELEIYSTCEIGYMNQMRFTEQTIDYLGLNHFRSPTSVSGGWLLAGNQHTLSQVIGFSESNIRGRFNILFESDGVYGHIDKSTTTDYFLIDIEQPIRITELTRYYNQEPGKYSEYTFEEVVEALKLRIKVVREELPNAKIGLYGVLDTNGQTHASPAYMDNYLIGIIEAGKLGLYDDLDYISPNFYTHHCEGDVRYYQIPDDTRAVIEKAMEINNSRGEPMDLAPLVANRIFATKSAVPGCQGSVQNPEAIGWQVDVLQKYDRVKRIDLWTGGDEEVIIWFEKAKLVPKKCFCEGKPFNRPPRAELILTPREGESPLEVRLTLINVIDPEGEQITYKWDFTRNGTIGATGPGPYTFIYTPKKGQTTSSHDPTVWLEDSSGAKSVAHNWLQIL